MRFSGLISPRVNVTCIYAHKQLKVGALKRADLPPESARAVDDRQCKHDSERNVSTRATAETFAVEDDIAEQDSTYDRGCA